MASHSMMCSANRGGRGWSRPILRDPQHRRERKFIAYLSARACCADFVAGIAPKVP
jgi:hypothetical protein